MTDRNSASSSLFPWVLTRFRLEDLMIAAAILACGFILSWLFPLFFWIGGLGAGLVLLAGRTVERSVVGEKGELIAPCDGVVYDIDIAIPPLELRMTSEPITRLRISSSPLTEKTLRAPLAGTLETVIIEPGERSAALALKPDLTGLMRAFIAIKSDAEHVGIVLTVGGLGPRLDIQANMDDMVLSGGAIGVRRLGGWCDLYIAEGASPIVRIGQTLIGGETPLATTADRVMGAAEMETAASATRSLPDVTREVTSTPSVGEAKTAEGAEDDLSPEEAAAKLFERLKTEARKSADAQATADRGTIKPD